MALSAGNVLSPIFPPWTNGKNLRLLILSTNKKLWSRTTIASYKVFSSPRYWLLLCHSTTLTALSVSVPTTPGKVLACLLNKTLRRGTGSGDEGVRKPQGRQNRKGGWAAAAQEFRGRAGNRPPDSSPSRWPPLCIWICGWRLPAVVPTAPHSRKSSAASGYCCGTSRNSKAGPESLEKTPNATTPWGKKGPKSQTLARGNRGRPFRRRGRVDVKIMWYFRPLWRFRSGLRGEHPGGPSRWRPTRKWAEPTDTAPPFCKAKP